MYEKFRPGAPLPRRSPRGRRTVARIGVRSARFPAGKTLEEFDFPFLPALEPEAFSMRRCLLRERRGPAAVHPATQDRRSQPKPDR